MSAVVVNANPMPSAPHQQPVVDTTRSPHAQLRPLPLRAVRLEGGFWPARLRTIRDVTLRQQYEQCEATGRIDHFRRASRKIKIDFVGRYYDDSDVYKWLEAAAYALTTGEDPELDGIVDSVIAEIADAQAPDGYLNTYFTFEREPERWADLDRMHQLYCAGHLIQAAVAHHRATGKRQMLDVAIRFADLICATFTPANPGTDGHEEIELALAELYRHTGNRAYIEQSVFFLDQRGRTPPLMQRGEYVQDHLPVREQQEIVGHAVRATYLACGMADAFAETGDPSLWVAVQALWESAFERKAYVTGGLGARWAGESFGKDYELPNERAYAETCAAIGGFMWNWRMLLITGEAKYADWMETALYNGILSGISLDGREYFYQNPLSNDGTHRRQPWFGTACCPPNIARLLLSLQGYLYTASQDTLWIHHYAPGEVRAHLPGGGEADLVVETNYPWEGDIRITVHRPGGAATLALRIPGWCEGAHVRVNGVGGDTPERGSYLSLTREWQEGDVVEVALPMPVRRVASHPRVAANTGRVALARGPLIYCLEGVDHPGVNLFDLALPTGGELVARHEQQALGGVTVIHGEGVEIRPDSWNGQLYRTDGEPESATPRPVALTAVPYFAWANRASGQMQVWSRSR